MWLCKFKTRVGAIDSSSEDRGLGVRVWRMCALSDIKRAAESERFIYYDKARLYKVFKWIKKTDHTYEFIGEVIFKINVA